MASFSEGLLLSEKVGLDPSVLVEVLHQAFMFYLFCFTSVNVAL